MVLPVVEPAADEPDAGVPAVVAVDPAPVSVETVPDGLGATVLFAVVVVEAVVSVVTGVVAVAVVGVEPGVALAPELL